jgi:hypothetical protein
MNRADLLTGRHCVRRRVCCLVFIGLAAAWISVFDSGDRAPGGNISYGGYGGGGSGVGILSQMNQYLGT